MFDDNLYIQRLDSCGWVTMVTIGDGKFMDSASLRRRMQEVQRQNGNRSVRVVDGDDRMVDMLN